MKGLGRGGMKGLGRRAPCIPSLTACLPSPSPCTVMFGGMCFCLPLALYLEKLDKAATAAENGGVNEPLLAAPGEVRWC